MTDSAIVTRIIEFLSSPDAEAATLAMSSLDKPLRDACVMIKFGGGAPYLPLASSDSIWLYTVGGGGTRLHELFRQSAYAGYINATWQEHPSVHLACIVPKLKKSK